MTFIPYAVSWNLTARCNLSCGHCYLDAHARHVGEETEMNTRQALDVVAQIAALNPEAVLILTGGEPLMRPDLLEIVAAGADAGLMVVLGTNGTLLDVSTAARLKAAGLSGVGISVDSLNADIHDPFRGKPGALTAAMNGLTAARDAGLGIQVQTTVMRDNIRDIPLIAQWAHFLGAKVYNLFFLVCVGRGEEMADISPEEYEEVLQWAATERDAFPGMMIRPKCAPHFKRVLQRNNPNDQLLSTYVAACRAGTHYLRITPSGGVTPCPYMENEAGRLSRQSLATIWEKAPELTIYRDPTYNGKCGACQYRLLCGGCRARALATSGDPMGEDQWCVYEPIGVEEALNTVDTDAKFGREGSSTITWDDDVVAILDKIPFFARPMVRMGVERKAAVENVDRITMAYFQASSPSPRMFAPKSSREEGMPESPAGDEIPWTPQAKERVKNAPEFVRPGIPKLMQKRAKERGKRLIDDAFLSEIRDESMMLASRRIKKLGMGELSMEAWDVASKKLFSRSPEKTQVIDTITELLAGRPARNEAIIERFGEYMGDTTGKKIGWSAQARQRMEKAPVAIREMAVAAVESYAQKHGHRIVTEEALEEALSSLPFGGERGVEQERDRV